MFPTFRSTNCREKKAESLQELFPIHPTYQNPIFKNPRPLLCKVSRFFGLSFFAHSFLFFGPHWTPLCRLEISCYDPHVRCRALLRVFNGTSLRHASAEYGLFLVNVQLIPSLSIGPKNGSHKAKNTKNYRKTEKQTLSQKPFF